MEVDDVFKRITQSAKLRIDWLTFEDGLIDFSGTEKGSLIAENVLIEALGELSLDKTQEEVAAALNGQFMVMNMLADLTDFVGEIAQKCSEEINAFVQVRTMESIGLPAEKIYADVKPKLLSLAIEASPVGDERRNIQTRLVEPIIQSGKTRFDYAGFQRRAAEEDSARGTERLDHVFEIILGLCSEIEEPPQMVKVLKAMMKPKTYPSWLRDFVNETMHCCMKEKCALMAMNIGYQMGQSIDEVERRVKFRLNH